MARWYKSITHHKTPIRECLVNHRIQLCKAKELQRISLKANFLKIHKISFRAWHRVYQLQTMLCRSSNIINNNSINNSNNSSSNSKGSRKRIVHHNTTLSNNNNSSNQVMIINPLRITESSRMMLMMSKRLKGCLQRSKQLKKRKGWQNGLSTFRNSRNRTNTRKIFLHMEWLTLPWITETFNHLAPNKGGSNNLRRGDCSDSIANIYKHSLNS